MGGFFLFYHGDWRILLKLAWSSYALFLLAALPDLPLGGMWISISPGGLSSSWEASLALLFPVTYALLLYRFRNRGWESILLCGMLFCLPGYLWLNRPDARMFLQAALPCFLLVNAAILGGHFRCAKGRGLLLVWAPTVLLTAFVLLQKGPSYPVSYTHLDVYKRQFPF